MSRTKNQYTVNFKIKMSRAFWYFSKLYSNFEIFYSAKSNCHEKMTVGPNVWM